jgi:hypothetical protein
MQWLNETYASAFNRRYRRSGHLFQGRFHSVVVEAEGHLSALTRHIHQNPVRAGIVAAPWEYVWSSCRAYLEMADTPAWLTTRWVLERFGRTPQEQRHGYLQFLTASSAPSPLDAVTHGALLGSEEFIREMRVKLDETPIDTEVSRMVEAAAVDPEEVARGSEPHTRVTRVSCRGGVESKTRRGMWRSTWRGGDLA